MYPVYTTFNGSTGQIRTDATSGGLVRSAHNIPTETQGVPSDLDFFENNTLDNTIDTDKTSKWDKRNDTATPQSIVFESKGTDTLYNKQIIGHCKPCRTERFVWMAFILYICNEITIW